jgi:hypothetical protein
VDGSDDVVDHFRAFTDPLFFDLVRCVDQSARSVVQSMVGALNKLPVAASGILFFGDPATFANVSSILVGFFAGLVVRQRSLLPWR